MFDHLGRVCYFDTVVGQVWVEDAGLLGCGDAWRVFYDVSKEHSTFIFRDNQVFLGLLALEGEGSTISDHSKQSPDDTSSHDRELGSSAVPP